MSTVRFLFVIAILLHNVQSNEASGLAINDMRLTQIESRLSKIEDMIERIIQTPEEVKSPVEMRDGSNENLMKRMKRHADDDDGEVEMSSNIKEMFDSMEQRLLVLSQTQAITITAQITAMFEAKYNNLTCSVNSDLADIRREIQHISPRSRGNISNAIQNSISDLRRTLIANISDLHESTVDSLTEFHEQQPTRNLSSINATSVVYGDCHAAWENGIRSPGVYTLKPPGYESFDAWCAFDHLHGWTVIQRRYNGSVNFYLPWDNYKNGFGDLNGEYWLGNDNIHALTRTNRKISIYLMKWNGEEATANYSSFYIDNESNNYKLTISGYSGNAGDSMDEHNGGEFSTRDRDNDEYSYNCATSYTGAWWYKSCYHANLNGLWTSSSRPASGGNILWYGTWGGNHAIPIHRTSMRLTRD